MKKILIATSLLASVLTGCSSNTKFDINLENLSEEVSLKPAVIAVHGRNFNLNANQNAAIADALKVFLETDDASELKKALLNAGAKKVLYMQDEIKPGTIGHFDFKYDVSQSKGVYLTGYQKLDESNYSYIGGLGIYDRAKEEPSEARYWMYSYDFKTKEYSKDKEMFRTYLTANGYSEEEE